MLGLIFFVFAVLSGIFPIQFCTYAQEWTPVEESRYNRNPVVFTVKDLATCEKIRSITQTGNIPIIAGGSRIDILMFDIEQGRGIESGDIIQFYSPLNLVGYSHTVSSEEINRGLRKAVDIQKYLVYRQVNRSDQFANENLNNIAKILETMNKFWLIKNAQSFSVRMRKGKVESAHNIPETIKCTELTTPGATVYFRRSAEDKSVIEILPPSALSKSSSGDNYIVKLQDFNALNQQQRSTVVKENLISYATAAEPADTIGMLFTGAGEVKQVHLKSCKKGELLNKTFTISEEKEDMGIIIDDKLSRLEQCVLSPNYFFNVMRYNPRKIGIEANYDEDNRNITKVDVHEYSIRNIYDVEKSAFLFWGQLKPEPTKTAGFEVQSLNIGVDQTREGYLLTDLDWLDGPGFEKIMKQGTLNTTIISHA